MSTDPVADRRRGPTSAHAASRPGRVTGRATGTSRETDTDHSEERVYV